MLAARREARTTTPTPSARRDDAPHPLKYQGMRSRLRDAAAEREVAPLPPDYRDDALRAVYAAVDDMLRADATHREIRVRDRDLVVLITDD